MRSVGTGRVIRAWAALGLVLFALLVVLRLATSGSYASRGTPPLSADPARAPVATSAPLLEGPAALAARAAVPAGDAPAPADPRVLRVQVRTKGGGARDKESVPCVAFELGLGWRRPSGAPLARGITDDEGQALIELPWSAIEAARASGGGARVLGRATQLGLQRRWSHGRLPDEPGELELVVLAVEGATLEGRLVDHAGRGRAGKLQALAPSGQRPPRVEVRADGDFELSFSREGRFDLLADSEHGSAVLRDLEVRLDQPLAPVELVLSGAGRLRGRVLDAAGRPAAALDLSVVAVEIDGDAEPSGLPQERALAARELRLLAEGRGQLRRQLRTASDGSFDARGLRPGLFHLRARVGPGNHETSLAGGPLEADGTELTLRFDRPHFAVRVVDEHGSPLQAAPQVGSRAPLRDEGPPQRWPESTTVIAAPSRAHAVEGRSFLDPALDTARLAGRALENGEVVFEARPGRYQLGLQAPGRPWEPVEVALEPGDARVEVVLVAPPPLPSGTLVASIAAPGGRPLREDVALCVEALADGLPLVRYSAGPGVEWPARIELPEGSYRVSAASVSMSGGFCNPTFGLRAFGAFSTTVVIRAGAEHALEARLGEGARIRLALTGGVREEDRESVRRHYQGLQVDMDYWAERASIVLVPEEGWPERVTFQVGDESNPRLVARLELGSQALSEPLPAGRFRLEARLPGGRVASREIELLEGRTAELELRFE